MPITARLSRLFYERLGEEIANELVDWLNSVDATYRADRRELNELNFSRFDAKLDQRLAELASGLRTEFRGALAELKTEFKGDITELRAELKGDITALKAELKGDIAGGRNEVKSELATGVLSVRAEMHVLKAELLRWMFLFWAGTALGGLLLR